MLQFSQKEKEFIHKIKKKQLINQFKIINKLKIIVTKIHKFAYLNNKIKITKNIHNK